VIPVAVIAVGFLALQLVPGIGKIAAAMTLAYCLGVMGWMFLGGFRAD